MSDTSNLSRFSDTSVLCRGEHFEVYIDRDEIRRRVAEIGEEISLRYAGKNPVLVGVLHGACMFLADLLRVLTIDCEVDFRRLSSYEEGTTSSGRIVEREGVARIDLSGRHVIVVEDIVDTGLTMEYLMERIRETGGGLTSYRYAPAQAGSGPCARPPRLCGVPGAQPFSDRLRDGLRTNRAPPAGDIYSGGVGGKFLTSNSSALSTRSRLLIAIWPPCNCHINFVKPSI